jgi:hypothetical protein
MLACSRCGRRRGVLACVVGAKKNLIVLAVGEIDDNQKMLTRLYRSIQKAKFAKKE